MVFSEVLECSLKFWAGRIHSLSSAVNQPWGFSPTAVTPQVPATELGFAGQACKSCAAVLQLIHAWLKCTKNGLVTKDFESNPYNNLNVCKNVIL